MQNIERHIIHGRQRPITQRTAIETETREEWALRNRVAYLAPGYVLLVELSSRGGTLESNYEERRVSRSRSQVVFHKEVDDPELEKRVKKAIAAVRWKLKKYGAPFFAGAYFIAEDIYPELKKEIEEDRKQVQAINDAAAHIESNRFTTIGTFALRADVNDREIAQRLGAAMYARLTALREGYTHPDKSGYQDRWNHCKNMDMLVAGKQRKIIKAALEMSDELTRTHLRAYRKKLKNRDHKAAEKIRADINYGPIDAAIELFEPHK